MTDSTTTTAKVADSVAPLPNFIARNLRLLRKRMGLSQQDLAEKVGLNRGNIASYESATAEPKICKLLRISNLFGVSTHDLTRYDLAETGRLESAMRAFHESQQVNRTRMDLLLTRIDEIEVVMSSVKNLYNFRAKDLDLAHPDVKAMSHYYEQMYSVAETLLGEHRALVNELRCHCEK
ncbi:hypothetical protein CEQ90_07735 [Lewinellaceae bacterium SD302]|nr:hypothetical protein CEQ90_07735 [Lewinellaceae bacterium SD302]